MLVATSTDVGGGLYAIKCDEPLYVPDVATVAFLLSIPRL